MTKSLLFQPAPSDLARKSVLQGVEQPHSFTWPSIPSFCAACRMTSASGVVVAGLCYGIVEALVTTLLGSTYTQIITFAVVIAALALLPNGLLGRAGVRKA